MIDTLKELQASVVGGGKGTLRMRIRSPQCFNTHSFKKEDKLLLNSHSVCIVYERVNKNSTHAQVHYTKQCFCSTPEYTIDNNDDDDGGFM